jgi:uncharacterized protein (DUF433 family)
MEKGEKPERLQKSFPKLSDENQRDALDFAKKLWRQEQWAKIPPKAEKLRFKDIR